MKRVFLALLFFSVFLNATDLVDVSKGQSVSIYKSVELSTDIKNIEDALANPQKFKEQKYFRRYLQFKKIDKNTWLKIDLENSSLEALSRLLYIKWYNTKIDIYLVDKDKIVFQERFTEYKNFKLSNSFTIEPKQKLQLYINAKMEKGVDEFLYLYIASQEVLPSLVVQKEKFHNGIFLGLLVSMMMYNFFMYFSMKIRSYLYLAWYQLMIVIYISDIKNYIVTFMYDEFGIFHWSLRTVPLLFSFIFSVLFTKEFLSVKESMPRINMLLNIFLILNIFLVPFLYVVNFVELLYILFIIAGFISFWQGNRYALFYIFGFSLTTAFHLFVNLARAFDMDVDISYQNYIQVLVVIEAFAFSMALYLKLKTTNEEKERALQEANEQKRIVLEQSKFATMGEMLVSIGHQWKQPLNHLNAIFGNIILAHEKGKLSAEYLNKKSLEMDKQLKYMATTIDDFSNFFSSKDELCNFTLKTICKKAIKLVSSRINKNNIKVELIVENDIEHTNHKNGLLQVLVIVINNSIDALITNNLENRHIKIIVESNSITVNDNGGGIPTEIIRKVFDLYFSTKDKKFGTGIGLYTAKIIMEKVVDGKIYAINSDDGASFIITIS